MAEGDTPYYSRLGKRFWKDATPWARDNIGWGVIVLLLPPALTFFRDRHAQIDWTNIRSTLVLYGVALPVYFLVHLIRTPKKLDQQRDAERASLEAERDAREADLRKELLAKDETIRQQKAALEKPKLTAAEQHDYETAKRVLKTLGETGLIGLRHIRRHGKLTFGTFPPVMPPGLTLDKTLWVFNHCASEGVLTCQGTHERTFAVAPKMEKILDELLYSEDTK